MEWPGLQVRRVVSARAVAVRRAESEALRPSAVVREGAGDRPPLPERAEREAVVTTAPPKARTATSTL
jgi:hypothetical protein